MKQKNKNRRNFNIYISVNSANNGFSLIEILVAIGIVSVGIITIVSLFNTNLKDEIRSKNKLIAVYLAQEAIEAVRWQRDTNWKDTTAGWDDELKDLLPNHDGITGLVNSDITQGWEIIKIVGAGNQYKKKVYYNKNDDYYAQSNTDLSSASGWQDTGFRRWITINRDCGDDCLTVTAYVSHPSFSPDIQVSARIYNWMP